MKNTTSFKKTLLASAIGSYAVMGLAGPAAAQEGAAPLEEVVVTGIRGSLNRAMDVKRDSQGVVDAIAAEDIGKFPDTNLAESLQRITGVSIDRTNGEGSRVTVRGFGPDYNLVTLNGRQMPTSAIQNTTAASTRSFDFANLASEGVSGVEVYKTGRASIPTGGIGSTINILTSRPLDNPGLNASFGVKGVIDESSDEGADVTPEISGLYSQTFADETFGVSISGSYQERESGSRVAGVSDGWHTFEGWVNQDWDGGTAAWGGIPDEGHDNRPGEGDIYSVPQQLAYTFNEVQRTRTNGQLAFQYRPVESLTATVDYTYSELEVAQQYSDMSAWFNFGPSTGEWTDGPIASPIRYSEQTPGLSDLAMGGGNFARVNENESTGINLDWQVNDQLNLTLDAHSSTAESRPDSPYGSHNVLGTAAIVRTQSTGYFGQDFPVLDIDLPEGMDQLNPEDVRVAGSSFRNSYMKMEIDQVQFEGTLEFDGGESIDFGIASTDVSNRSAYANVQRDTWGGVGDADDFDNDTWVREDVSSHFSAPGVGSEHLFDQRFVFDFEEVVERSEQLYPGDGGPVGDCGTEFCPSTDYAGQTDRYTDEDTISAFVQLNIETDLAGMPVDVATGLRYERTNVHSKAAVPVYDGVRWVSDNEFGLIATGDQEYTDEKGSYNMFLPSFDASIEVVPDVILRASASQTITRPGYGDIQGGTTLNPGARINGGDAQRGNPDLLPFESINADLSAEWYYDTGSYMSVGLFWKDVTNFIGTSFEEESFGFHNPADGPRYDEAVAATGSTEAGAIREYIIDNYGDTEGVDGTDIIGLEEDNDLPFTVSVPVNEKDASLHGMEFAVQHAFGDSGFGTIANYTLVDGDVTYQDGSLDTQFALLGLSDSANLIGYYDKNGLQARIAYNWRDKFLAGIGHGTGFNNPVYTEAYGQVDLNVSYDLTDSFTAFVEGINVTDEYTRQHARAKNQIMSLTELGPRYNIGVRYSF